jgi:D-psicose/D-tagatose/L-ribulose 3-epimerase
VALNPLACLVNVVEGDADQATLPGLLDSLAALGYTHVGLPPLDPRATDAPAIGALFQERSLSPITMFGGHTPSTQVSSADVAERRAATDAMKDVVDLAVAIGSTQLNGVQYGVFGHPTSPTTPDEFARAAREVGAVADYAHERGITMTFEVLNRYETSVVNTAAQAMAFVAASESEHLRIHLDTFHMAIEEADMFAAIDLALPKLGYLELGQSGRALLSTGVVDVEAVVAHAVSAGYLGPIGVEAFSRSVLASPVADALSIWREPYVDGLALAADAIAVMRRGISLSR